MIYYSYMDALLNSVWHYVGILWPYGLAILIVHTSIQKWMEYVRTDFNIKQGSTLLEIKIPREIMKSPLAMELVFTALHLPIDGNWVSSYLKGNVRPWFSCEIISDEGNIRFFIWTQTKFKDTVEAQLYAQYPTVEVYEVPDYVSRFKFDPEKQDLYGACFKLTAPDVYPIKTYVDYGMDKDPKEEFKIDPLTSTLETMSTLKKGEQMWIQIIIQAHMSKGLKAGHLFKTKNWQDEAKEEIEKIREESTPKTEDDYPGFPNPTKGEMEKIAAIERSIGKFPFDCAIRGMYFADKEIYNKGRPGVLGGVFRQYSSNYLNGFKRGWHINFDYPWQDFMGIRLTGFKRAFFEAYRTRGYFHGPFKNFAEKPFILMTEELATIFHFPGSVSQAPGLSRIPSKKSDAPSNLPI